MRRVVIGVLALLIAGCGGGGDGSASGGPSAGSTTSTPSISAGSIPPPPSTGAGTMPAVPSTTAGSAAPGGASTAGSGPVDARAFCAFLKEDASKLASAGSAPGALAQLAGDLAGWIKEHPEQKPRTAADLDAASQANCPELRAQVVAFLGGTSFADTIGGG